VLWVVRMRKEEGRLAWGEGEYLIKFLRLGFWGGSWNGSVCKSLWVMGDGRCVQLIDGQCRTMISG